MNLSSYNYFTELLAEFEYEVDMDLNVTDIAAVDDLRRLFNSASYSITLGPAGNITQSHITTGKL